MPEPEIFFGSSSFVAKLRSLTPALSQGEREPVNGSGSVLWTLENPALTKGASAADVFGELRERKNKS